MYIIFWDGGILWGTTYEVFEKGHSGWWFLLAVVLMICSFKPYHFGLSEKPKEKQHENI